MIFQIDVIVNTTNVELDLKNAGPSCKAILAAAGDNIQKECDAKYKSNINPGDVAVTGPGYLKCENIFHIFIPMYKNPEDEKVRFEITCNGYIPQMKIKHQSNNQS